MPLLLLLYQLVIMWYSHVFDTQYTHHSIISRYHLTQCETALGLKMKLSKNCEHSVFFSYFYQFVFQVFIQFLLIVCHCGVTTDQQHVAHTDQLLLLHNLSG